jgi:hypothetical protein
MAPPTAYATMNDTHHQMRTSHDSRWRRRSSSSGHSGGSADSGGALATMWKPGIPVSQAAAMVRGSGAGGLGVKEGSAVGTGAASAMA